MYAILGPYISAGCWVSLKDLMFFVDELPNLVDLMEDYETNLHFSMHHDAHEELLQAWKDSVVRLSNEYLQ